MVVGLQIAEYDYVVLVAAVVTDRAVPSANRSNSAAVRSGSVSTLISVKVNA